MDEDQLGQLIGSGFVAFFGIIVLCAIGAMVALIAGMWKVFEKAAKPGWAAIVPIYNVIVLLEITGRPLWWIFLFLIPLVNVGVSFVMYYDLAKSFGQEIGYALGLMLLGFIFFPLLGFGSAKYLGPAARFGSIPPNVSNSGLG